MPLRSRLIFASLSILTIVAWIVWTLSGIIEDRFVGFHDMANVFLTAMIPAGFLVAAIGDTSWRSIAPLAKAVWRHRRRSNPLYIAVGAWFGFLLLIGFVALKGLHPDFGSWGDSFNILTCLFLAYGFHFTIKQLRHSEESAKTDESRQERAFKFQANAARIQTLQAKRERFEAALAKAMEVYAIGGYLNNLAVNYDSTGDESEIANFNVSILFEKVSSIQYWLDRLKLPTDEKKFLQGIVDVRLEFSALSKTVAKGTPRGSVEKKFVDGSVALSKHVKQMSVIIERVTDILKVEINEIDLLIDELTASNLG